MDLTMKFNLLVVIGCLISISAHAEIYKYVDEDGRITYSNVSRKGAKKLDLDTLPPQVKNKTATPTPSAFPKVENSTQRKRDESRRRVLEAELEAEEKNLANAKVALKEGEEAPEMFKVKRTIIGKDGKPQTITETRRNVPKYDEKIKTLQEAVSLHESNVEALKKELAGIK